MRRVQVHPVNWPIGLDTEVNAWRQLDATFGSFDPHFNRMSTHCISPTERLEIILCHQSLQVRATDLCVFIERCQPEALKDNYQLIIDNIFSHRNREQSWDLRSMRRPDHPREALAVFKLLAPDGPLITLALRLMDDHNFLLEFPIDGLPYYLRQRLSQLDIPPFFTNKVGMAYDLGLQRNVVQHLLLNPFEYYIFCFGALNLLGLNTGRSPDYLHGWASLQDTIYTNILEDYLSYYFPCDGTGVPCHNFNYNAPQANEAVFMANSLLRQQYPKQKIMGQTFQGDSSSHQVENALPKLFKSSILQEQSGAASSRDNLFLTTHPSAYKEVWRSETMLHIFMELWMCGFHESIDKNSIGSISPLNYGGLPSVEVVKSVRMLVRNLHYFINCVNSHAMHPMEEIRRNTYPIFQRRLYTFLRYLFHHWPLDNSFRIVYETWLSHIQPWRYTHVDRTKNRHTAREVTETPVDRRWFNFILENILFYSKLFSQILIRLERIDLSATKNALMFYRLAKVMTTQDNLKMMLIDIETNLQNYDRQAALVATNNQSMSQRQLIYSTPASGRGSFGGGVYFGGGKLSPIVASPNSPSPIGSPCFYQEPTSALKIVHLKQLIKDFESSHYVYEPIFSEDNNRRIKRLILAASDARDNLHSSAAKISECQSNSNKSAYQWFVSWFYSKPSNQLATIDAAERTKAAIQLECARNQFAQFFDIQIADGRDQPSGSGDKKSSESDGTYFDSQYRNGYSSGSSYYFDDSRKKCFLSADTIVDETLIPYGNPDVSLIRSDEWPPLVRFLHWTATMINNLFGERFEQLYLERNWKGRITRALLAEPKEYIVSERLRGPGIRKPMRSTKYLPPRISLRFFGSYYSLCYVFIWLVLISWFNLGPIGSIAMPILLYMFYISCKAAN